MRHIAVVAPHPDDEAIGCGGAICHHIAQGDHVTVFFLSSGELGLQTLPREEAWNVRESEARRAAQVLGVQTIHFLRIADYFVGESIESAASLLSSVLTPVIWDRIYLPHVKESHPDHRVALDIVLLALGMHGISTTIFAYEVWTPFSEYNRIVDISNVMPRKLEAVRCYTSQLASFRYDRAVRGLNSYRGALGAHCRYAEAFMVIEQEDVANLIRQVSQRMQ